MSHKNLLNVKDLVWGLAAAAFGASCNLHRESEPFAHPRVPEVSQPGQNLIWEEAAFTFSPEDSLRLSQKLTDKIKRLEGYGFISGREGAQLLELGLHNSYSYRENADGEGRFFAEGCVPYLEIMLNLGAHLEVKQAPAAQWIGIRKQLREANSCEDRGAIAKAILDELRVGNK